MIVYSDGLLAAFASLVLAAVAGRPVVAALRALGFGQQVRSDGPETHLKKSGTPTMGGLFIVGTVATVALVAGRQYAFVVPAVLAMLAFTSVGFVDDYLSVRRGRSLGLKARHKLMAQTALGAAVAIYGLLHPDLETAFAVPFSEAELVLPAVLYIVVVAAAVVATTNAVNLTDGLDGLAAETTGAAAAAFALLAFSAGIPGVGVFAASVMGACLGFLWHNSYPASVIMGDTGSLGLGAALAVAAVFSRSVLWLPLVGAVFVAETLSVILQVTWFRRTGKRLLRMSPLHHHFELAGWQEPQIVRRFVLIGILCALLGLWAA